MAKLIYEVEVPDAIEGRMSCLMAADTVGKLLGLMALHVEELEAFKSAATPRGQNYWDEVLNSVIGYPRHFKLPSLKVKWHKEGKPNTERVAFILPSRMIHKSAPKESQIRHLLEMSLNLTLGRSKWSDVAILCKPAQFARFLIMRDQMGLANEFKALEPILVHEDDLENQLPGGIVLFDVTKNNIRRDAWRRIKEGKFAKREGRFGANPEKRFVTETADGTWVIPSEEANGAPDDCRFEVSHEPPTHDGLYLGGDLAEHAGDAIKYAWPKEHIAELDHWTEWATYLKTLNKLSGKEETAAEVYEQQKALRLAVHEEVLKQFSEVLGVPAGLLKKNGQGLVSVRALEAISAGDLVRLTPTIGGTGLAARKARP